MSSVIVRIQNHEAHCLCAVTTRFYHDPVTALPAARDCGAATSTCCVSENNQTPADLLWRPYSLVMALVLLVGVAGCSGFCTDRNLIAWQRKRFRDHWAKLSQQGKPGRPFGRLTPSPTGRGLGRGDQYNTTPFYLYPLIPRLRGGRLWPSP